MEHPVIQHHKRRHLNPKIKKFLYMTGDFIGTCLVGAYLGYVIVVVMTGP